MTETVLLKLSSVALTREKQIPIQEEFSRYEHATNWVIKKLLKNRLTKRTQIMDRIRDEFSERFDRRESYQEDVVRSACAEISRHRKLAVTIISMRDKTPLFKQGRMILSQPLIEITPKAVVLTLPDRTKIPIPFDKFSRNQNADYLSEILKGTSKVDAQGKRVMNKKYGRIRLTWNKEGFMDIDIRANFSLS